MVDVPDGAPNCIASDPLTPGRFYLALQGGGLWRSDDGGQSWKNAVARDVNWVAPDFKVANRVAAVTPTGVLVSTDAGATWREASPALPYRHARNTVCFAGEQIVVGTGGNGVFTAAVSSLQGAARPLARAASTSTPPASTSALHNGDMSEGEGAPSEWSLGSWKEGQISMARDAAMFASAPASLRLETQGKAMGVAQQALSPTPRGEVKVAGKWKVQGDFDSVQAVLQSFDGNWKQVGWQVLADGPKASSDWQNFAGAATVVEGAVHVLLNISASGTGRVWVDDVSATTQSNAQSNGAPQVLAAAPLPVVVAPSDALLGLVATSTAAPPIFLLF
jgi:hypothetical protein